MRNYSSKYRIRGKAAEYYLSSKGITYLRDEQQLDKKVLHSFYKNKSVAQSFIDHNLDGAAVCVALRKSYPNTFEIFTKQEIAEYAYFPKVRPDIYLDRVTYADDIENEYMLEVFSESTQLWVVRKRVLALIEHFDSGEWDEAKTDYPSILLVLATKNAEKSLQAFVAKTLDDTGIDNLAVYTTTMEALNGSDVAIWTDVQDTKELVSL